MELLFLGCEGVAWREPMGILGQSEDGDVFFRCPEI